MRKILCTACAVLLSAACLCSLAACGDGSSGGGTDTEKPSFEKLVSEQLTETEWNSAFLEENFENVEYYGTSEEYSPVTVICDGDTRMIEIISGCMVLQEFVIRESDKYYTSNIYDGRNEADIAAWEKWSVPMGICGWFWQAADYSEAVWNDSENGYVITAEGKSVVVKFQNKKLVAYYEMASAGKERKWGMFSQYGTASWRR